MSQAQRPQNFQAVCGPRGSTRESLLVFVLLPVNQRSCPEGLPPPAFSLTALAWHLPCGQSGPNPLQTHLGSWREEQVLGHLLLAGTFHVTLKQVRLGHASFFLGRMRGGSVPQGPREGTGSRWRRHPEMLRRRAPRPVFELVGVCWPVLPLVLCEWKPQEHGAFGAPGGCWAQLTMVSLC